QPLRLAAGSAPGRPEAEVRGRPRRDNPPRPPAPRGLAPGPRGQPPPPPPAEATLAAGRAGALAPADRDELCGDGTVGASLADDRHYRIWRQISDRALIGLRDPGRGYVDLDVLVGLAIVDCDDVPAHGGGLTSRGGPAQGGAPPRPTPRTRPGRCGRLARGGARDGGRGAGRRRVALAVLGAEVEAAQGSDDRDQAGDQAVHLFVPQGFNRMQSGGSVGRIDAEEESDAHRHAE